MPTAVRKQLLEELHAAHQGRDQTLARARQCIFWPGITRDIENKVRGCEQCETYKASQSKEPLVQDKRPTRPGEAIARDLFSYGGGEYLIITDKYSDWSEVYGYQRGVSTKDVAGDIMKWMTTLGVPVRMTTNGGPQFKGLEFKEFCEKCGINHDPSSTYYHIVNGYAEAAVKTMKALVKKTSPKGGV